VPESAAIRVDLLASRLACRIRAVGRLLTLATAAACGTAALLEPSPAAIAAAAAALGALAVSFASGRGSAAGWRIEVDADGTFRAGNGAADRPAAVRYFGRHFVCLGTADGLLAVWPDSMSRTDWRRLVVACRWQRPPSGDGGQVASGLRTK